MAAKTSIINVEGVDISVISQNDIDYISLTNMTEKFEGGSKLIEKWLSTKNTVEFLGVWERIHNPNFNSPEFGGIYNETGSNKFYLSIKKFIERTNAIGIIAKPGRMGGTYAHKDIAYHFGMWLSPEFNLLVLKEFQRLKEEETKYLKSPEWLHRRFLVSANYTIQTDAVKTHLIPFTNLPKEKHGIIYAGEAEVINYAVLGITAKQWSLNNPQLVLKGENIRDHLDTVHLIVLDNMQTLNSHLIGQKISQEERIKILRTEAHRQIESLSKSKSIQNMKQESLSDFNQSLKQTIDFKDKE